MPKVLRQVEQDVGAETLVQELREFVKQSQMPAPALGDGSEVKEGDVLIPDYEQLGQIAPDTHVLVVEVTKHLGLLQVAYHMKTGQTGVAFFNANQMKGRVNTPKPAPAKRGRKPRQ